MTWVKHADDTKKNIQKIQDSKIYPLANSWKNDNQSLYEQNDARIYWFIGAARMTNNLKLGYISLQSLGDIRSWQIIAKPVPVESDIKDWLREYETFILWAYIHGLCTITEETLRLIYQARGKTETDEFKNIYDHLLTITNGSKYITLFDLFRLMRNMTHNNGIFLPKNQKDTEIEWAGKKYNFQNGKGINFADVSFFIETITVDICDAMDFIMSSSEIAKLPLIKRRIKTK